MVQSKNHNFRTDTANQTYKGSDLEIADHVQSGIVQKSAGTKQEGKEYNPKTFEGYDKTLADRQEIEEFNPDDFE